MCGIAGLIQLTQSRQLREDGAQTLQKILGRVRHRGPDGQGSWQVKTEQWSVFLGHTRLSILDLEMGAQPMKSKNEESVITFNGEIFNFQDLKNDLQKAGIEFQTRSDTEVLLYQFQQKGIEGLAQLNGMFAFAVWEASSKRLTLVRDPCGIKPLYYAPLPEGGLIFCSELTGILEHPQIKKKLSLEALASYFFSDYAHAPLSIIEGVYKLEPGHVMTWHAGVLSAPRAYSNSETQRDVLTRSTQASSELSSLPEMEKMLWSTLNQAVQKQLVADVPMGVFLSGGVDSSSIAACAQGLSREPIQTFSIAFEEKSYDESHYAKRVAQHLGTRHLEQKFSAEHLIDVFEQAIESLDEPLADPSLLPTYLLSQVAARSVKVVLGGDGADELLAGYPTYQAHRLSEYYGLIPKWMQAQAADWVSLLPVREHYQSLEWKLKRFTGRWDDFPLQRHLRWMASLDLDQVRAILPAFQGYPATYKNVRKVKDGSSGSAKLEGQLQDFLDLDFSTYLPGSVLAKVDRAAMAHGLEVRPPFLDHDFVAFARRLPAELKLHGSVGKYLLKRAAAPYLPSKIIRRPKKGFGIPVAKFLRGPLKDRLQSALNDSPLWDILNRGTFMKWFEEHQALRDDHARPLWAFLVLDTWVKKEGIHAQF